ncbi:hypothetical protein RB195_019663 [Necator americanus]|uniref:Uncharacterized protein n=1 Tax=Necator americanus TaxID=51031 RepID=A0ABR1CF78_NECAM
MINNSACNYYIRLWKDKRTPTPSSFPSRAIQYDLIVFLTQIRRGGVSLQGLAIHRTNIIRADEVGYMRAISVRGDRDPLEWYRALVNVAEIGCEANALCLLSKKTMEEQTMG